MEPGISMDWAMILSGGLVPHLPLMKPALAAITSVYLLRGLAPVAILLAEPAMMSPFWLWSSAICLGFGIIHGVGLLRA